jgi:hypothetical protein
VRCAAGPDRHGTPDQDDPRLRVSLLGGNQPQQMQAVHIILVVVQDGAVERGGLVEPACPVQHHRFGERGIIHRLIGRQGSF